MERHPKSLGQALDRVAGSIAALPDDASEPEGLSELEAVVVTAAAMGRVDEANIRAAARALRGAAS